MALIKEILRQRRKDLTVVTFLGGIDVELLLAGDCVRKVRAALVSLDLVGLAPLFARAHPSKCIVETEASLVFGMRASAQGLSFLPARGTLHTDIPSARRDFLRVESPYEDEHLVAFPALKLDVALIHTSWATPLGTAGCDSAPILDRLLSEVSSTTIVTTERILEGEQPIGPVLVRRSQTTAVVEAPFGAHPTGCFPHYRQDIALLTEYSALATERGPEAALRLFADSSDLSCEHFNRETLVVNR